MTKRPTTEIELHFLQLDPGTEEKFCRRHLKGIPHWEGLGKYDVVCATAPDGRAGKPAFRLEWLRPYAQDFVQLRLFRLPGTPGPSDVLEWLWGASKAQKWLGVTLLKVPPSLQFSKSLKPLEHHATVASDVYEYCRGKNISAVVLGGYGWHELAVLVAGPSLAGLASVILGVARLPRENRPLVQKTFTTFALSYEFLRRDRAEKRRDAGDLRSGLRAGCFVICRQSPTRDIVQSLERHFKGKIKPAFVYGSEDIFLSSDSDLSVPDFFKGVLGLRTAPDTAKEVLSTSTFVAMQEPSGAPGGLATPHRPCGVDKTVDRLLQRGLTISLVGTIRQSSAGDADAADIVRHATRLDLVLNASLRSGLVRDAYLDLIPFLASCNREPLAFVSSARVILDYVQAAYQQRFAGTFNTIWNTGDPAPLVYRAGVQRVLWAVEYLCHSLLERRGCRWTGFAVFGQLREYLRTHRGIINVPHRAIFDPCAWFGIFHEIGHEYVYQKLGQLRGWERMVSAAFQLSHVGRGRHEVYWHTNELVWEVLSDIFGFRFGFHRDWVLYCDVVFEYQAAAACTRAMERSQAGRLRGWRKDHTAMARERLSRYLVRLYAVYWYNSLRGSRRAPGDSGPLAGFKEDVRPRLEKVLKRLVDAHGYECAFKQEILSLLDGDDLEDLLGTYVRVGRLFVTDPGRKILDFMFPPGEKDPAPVGSLKRDMELLEQGRPLASVTEPERIICELANRGRLSEAGRDGPAVPVPMRIATILSFWNAYARCLPGIVADISRRSRKADA